MADSGLMKERLRRYWRRTIRVAAIFSALFIAGVLTAAFVVMLFLHQGLPSVASLKDYRPKTVTQVFSEHGEVIAEFFEERRYVESDIPQHIKNAFIAAEDASFYRHKGLDFLGILRAAYVNLKTGRASQGASTITQQVARSFLLTREKKLSRKIREAILAWQIEKSLEKEQIIRLYLNHIYLGSGTYGVAAAAKRYFGKSLEEVTLAEAAILGGLPQAPHEYSPARNPDRAKRRQLYVLKQMRQENLITQEEYDQAIKQEVLIEPAVNVNRYVSPYFSEHIRRYLMEKYGARRVLQEGLKVYTTLDVEMNRHAQNALRKGLSDLEKRQGYRGPLKKLKGEELANYFSDRDFSERDDDSVVANAALEVSQAEAKQSGEIRMKPPKKIEVGDVLEGLVREVRDAEGFALVEYEPRYYARIPLDEMRWASQRVASEDDEDFVLRPVNKVSDVLEVGDVIFLSVKSIPEESGKPIQASLEQVTEVEGALVSMDPQSGFVKAMIGGYSFERSEFNRAVQARRQPGSSFKPIIYAAALDLGFTPASLLQDSPITFENPADAEKWRPSNYDNQFVGDVTLRSSLLTSRNIPTIRLLNEIGLDTAVEYAKRLGIESTLTRDFTLALGSSVTTLLEITQPYVAFANGGYRKRPVMIKRVLDRNNEVLEENVIQDVNVSQLELVRQAMTNLKKDIAAVEFSKASWKTRSEGPVSFLQERSSDSRRELKVISSPLKPGQVLSSETSFLMAHLLKENVLYGTGRRARELKRTAAGKTGTTDENRDAWFIGFTPDLVAGVWVGHDDLKVLGRNETGSQSALPIWVDFMARATVIFPDSDFQVPSNIEFAKIDPKTGGLAGPQTRTPLFEAFIKGTAPKEVIRTTAPERDLYERDL